MQLVLVLDIIIVVDWKRESCLKNIKLLMNRVSWLTLNKAITFLLFHDITELGLNLWCFRDTHFKHVLRIFCFGFLRISFFFIFLLLTFFRRDHLKKNILFYKFCWKLHNVTRKVSNFFSGQKLFRNTETFMTWHKISNFFTFHVEFHYFLIFFSSRNISN